MNTLYYGDNLDVLRRYVKDETVDLVYLDPPFNSNATYNVLPNFNLTNIQKGSTGDDGSFTVNFNEGGLWQVGASYDINEPSTWTATSCCN